MTNIMNNQIVTIDGLTYTAQNASKAYSLTQPTPGTLRFEVRQGDHWTYDPTTKDRSEIAGNTHYPVGTQINVAYAWSIEAGPANIAPWEVMGQFHQVENLNYSPPFQIGFYGGEKMSVWVNYLNANGSQAYKQLWLDSQNIVRGHTYQMAIQATFDQGNGKGRLIVSRDGAEIVDYTGSMGFPGMNAVYWKEGIYRAASSTTIAADYSGLTITTGSTQPVAPTSTPDAYSAKAWSEQTLVVAAPGVLANDVGHNNKPLTAQVTMGVAHGTLAMSPDGGFSYTPDSGFIGTDNFSYIATDGVTSGPPTQVVITVL